MVGYAQVDPSFPERIMRMAEKTAADKQENIATLAKAEAFGAKVSPVIGGIISALSITAAVILGVNGAALPALGASIPAVGITVSQVIITIGRSKEHPPES